MGVSGVLPGGRLARAIGAAACCLLAASTALALGPEQRFRDAGELARAGDYPKAIAVYESLAATGSGSAPLYWNWAQAASARGATGEALWALLRARELDPSDRAVGRDIDRLREAANLDRAEIAPDPMSAVARAARRYRLGVIAMLLLAISLGAHAGFRWRRAATRLVPIAWTTLALGLLAAVAPIAGSFAHPCGAVVRRGAPLLDAASPTAAPLGALREGEVVPILETSGEYVRVEDSSGARGWALASDVRSVSPSPSR